MGIDKHVWREKVMEARTDREILIQMDSRIEAIEEQMENTVIRLNSKQIGSIILIVLGAFGIGTGAI